MNTLEKLAEIVGNQLGIEKSSVKKETALVEDLGADSLDKVEMIMAVENEFGIEIDDDAVLAFTTIGDVVNYIDNKTA